MNEITFRIYSTQKSIDPGFLQSLEVFIEQNGYHLSAEQWKRIALAPETPKRISHEEFIRLSAELSQRMRLQSHDSADLIREDRDNR